MFYCNVRPFPIVGRWRPILRKRKLVQKFSKWHHPEIEKVSDEIDANDRVAEIDRNGREVENEIETMMVAAAAAAEIGITEMTGISTDVEMTIEEWIETTAAAIENRRTPTVPVADSFSVRFHRLLSTE